MKHFLPYIICVLFSIGSNKVYGGNENDKTSVSSNDRFFIGLGAPEAKENFRFPIVSAEWQTQRFFTWKNWRPGLYLSYGETEYEDALGIMQNRYRSHFLLEMVKSFQLSKQQFQFVAAGGLRIENTAYADEPRETLVHSKDLAYGYALKWEKHIASGYSLYVEQRISSAPGEIFWNGNSLSLGLTFSI